jgi:hypothetical protein
MTQGSSNDVPNRAQNIKLPPAALVPAIAPGIVTVTNFDFTLFEEGGIDREPRSLFSHSDAFRDLEATSKARMAAEGAANRPSSQDPPPEDTIERPETPRQSKTTASSKRRPPTKNIATVVDEYKHYLRESQRCGRDATELLTMSEYDEGILRSMMGGPDSGWFQPGTATWLTKQGQEIGGALLEGARQAEGEWCTGALVLVGCAARPVGERRRASRANHDPRTLLDQQRRTRFEEWFETQLQKEPAECDIPEHLRPPADANIHEYLRVGRPESASSQSRSRSNSPATVIGINEPLPPSARGSPAPDEGADVNPVLHTT